MKHAQFQYMCTEISPHRNSEIPPAEWAKIVTICQNQESFLNTNVRTYCNTLQKSVAVEYM
jgi:hypothetical protein